MSSNPQGNEPPDKAQPGLSALSPQMLYDRCMARERELKGRDWNKVREGFAKELIFGPIFHPDAQSDQETGESDPRLVKIGRVLGLGTKYRDLLELLRKANDRESRWILVARWLRQEGVCEPEAFLPSKRYGIRYLTKKLWKGIRRKDLVRVIRVEIWLPYFQKLLKDRDSLAARGIHRIQEEMKKLGYEQSAVEAAGRKTSPLEAIYDWLEVRGLDSAASTRNAYSSACGALRKLTPEAVAAIYGREIEELRRRGETSGLLAKAIRPRN